MLVADDITLTNISHLPIELKAKLEAPFYIVKDGERLKSLEVCLDADENATLKIEFQPQKDDKRCCVKYGILELDYKAHPNKVFSLLVILNYMIVND